ncbi:MAG: TfoX/Sxy family protein [Opitutus sp.]
MKKITKALKRERASTTASKSRRGVAEPEADTASDAKPEAPLINRVRTALEHVTKVREKKMFGSTGFMVRGKLCVSARAERIMCRIDPALHAAAVKRRGCQTVVMRGRPYPGFVYVAAHAVRTDRALRVWIELALDHNQAKAL